MDSTVVLVLIIFFISTFLRSVVGFGNALIAMPLLAVLLGISTATPLVALTGPLLSLGILLFDWKQVDLKSTWQLLLASILGIPLGLLFLGSGSDELVTTILAIILILFGTYSLFARQIPLLGDGWAFPFGFIAGVLGGAYNTNGPPIVVYSSLKRWNPDRFRGTLQGYFLPTGLLVAASHGLAGLWTTDVVRLFLYSIPVNIVALLAGNWLHQRIPEGKFDRLVYVLLIALGIFLWLD
ncbi:MAG: sulfite exporter TauE/SafE family protein [Anaerolineales bacterium]|nr:sulfite exporter TauE/SafE family protein [Anaerolineales bacterium]